MKPDFFWPLLSWWCHHGWRLDFSDTNKCFATAWICTACTFAGTFCRWYFAACWWLIRLASARWLQVTAKSMAAGCSASLTIHSHFVYMVQCRIVSNILQWQLTISTQWFIRILTTTITLLPVRGCWDALWLILHFTARTKILLLQIFSKIRFMNCVMATAISITYTQTILKLVTE